MPSPLFWSGLAVYRHPVTFVSGVVISMKILFSAPISALLATAAIGAVAAHPAQAADAKGAFALRGIGAESCQIVTGAILKGDASVRVALQNWLLGYISAVNRTQKDTFDAVAVQDPDALANMELGICQQHPEQSIEAVSNAVVVQMAPGRLVGESPVMQVSANGQATTLRKDTLVAVQKVLIEAKLLSGKADGAFGKDTTVALQAFQKAQSLPQTGVPDPATIIRALVELPAEKKKK